MNWTLVIYIYAGMLAKGDSVTITHIDGFAGEPQCVAAANITKQLVNGSTKEHRFVCFRKG